jgi:hypothetical protein
MGNFVFKKSKNSNIIKSIRFDEELYNSIDNIVKQANKGKSKKEYSFNRFCLLCLSICNRQYEKISLYTLRCWKLLTSYRLFLFIWHFKPFFYKNLIVFHFLFFKIKYRQLRLNVNNKKEKLEKFFIICF